MSARDGYLQGLLSDALTMAVQLEIGRLREADEEQRLAVLSRLQETQRRDGSLGALDSMQYGGGEVSGSFAAVTRAVAVMAFQPGGVRFAGRTWCGVHHPGGVRAEGICPVCLDEEIAAKRLAS